MIHISRDKIEFDGELSLQMAETLTGVCAIRLRLLKSNEVKALKIFDEKLVEMSKINDYEKLLNYAKES